MNLWEGRVRTLRLQDLAQLWKHKSNRTHQYLQRMLAQLKINLVAIKEGIKQLTLKFKTLIIQVKRDK